MQKRTAWMLMFVVLVCFSPADAEHLDEFAWMEGLKGRKGQSCCGVADCIEATVALLEQGDVESTVMIGDTVVVLPNGWVYPSQGPTGVWCFVSPTVSDGQAARYVDGHGRTREFPPEIPSRENTRCAAYLSLN